MSWYIYRISPNIGFIVNNNHFVCKLTRKSSTVGFSSFFLFFCLLCFSNPVNMFYSPYHIFTYTIKTEIFTDIASKSEKVVKTNYYYSRYTRYGCFPYEQSSSACSNTRNVQDRILCKHLLLPIWHLDMVLFSMRNYYSCCLLTSST